MKTTYERAGLGCPKCQGSMFEAWDLGYQGGGSNTFLPSYGPTMAPGNRTGDGGTYRTSLDFNPNRVDLQSDNAIIRYVTTDAIRFVKTESVRRLRCINCSHREEVRR